MNLDALCILINIGHALGMYNSHAHRTQKYLTNSELCTGNLDNMALCIFIKSSHSPHCALIHTWLVVMATLYLFHVVT